MTGRPDATRPLATLRRFVRPQVIRQCCELCAAAMGPVHAHLLDRSRRQLVCACEACAFLFSHRDDGKLRRISPRAELLRDFQLTDVQWRALNVPIGLAFFVHDSAAELVRAVYPSPGGATESSIDNSSWHELAEQNPVLRELEPDVEALLINRLKQTRDHYRVSIDHCYELVGLIRKHWRGLSGGQEVWQEVSSFFDRLRARR